MCFPCFSCIFLKLCFFSCQFSAVSSILWSFRYAFCCIPCDFTGFFNFRLVSLHFATMFYNFEMLPFPFNWLYVALILLYFVVRDDKQTGKPTHSVYQARSFTRCILHNNFCYCSPCLLRSSICPFYFSRLNYHHIHCVFSFYQANFTTSNNEQQKTTRNNIM